MSEFCLDCYNKIMETRERKKKFVFSLCPELCEECGQYKRVIVRVKMRYILKEELTEAVVRYRKSRPSNE